MTEAQHQAMVFKWSQQPGVRQKYPDLKLLHHIPNGGNRDAIEGRHLKQQGVRAGVPDLDLPVPRSKYHGLRIEMKTDKGKLSEAQEWWIRELNAQDYMAVVCRSWEEAVRVIQDYLDST